MPSPSSALNVSQFSAAQTVSSGRPMLGRRLSRRAQTQLLARAHARVRQERRRVNLLIHVGEVCRAQEPGRRVYRLARPSRPGPHVTWPSSRSSVLGVSSHIDAPDSACDFPIFLILLYLVHIRKIWSTSQPGFAMVDLKHCPSAPPVDNSDVPLLQRMKEHAIEFYEASPEQHRQCLRNTFNKVCLASGWNIGPARPRCAMCLQLHANAQTTAAPESLHYSDHAVHVQAERGHRLGEPCETQ